jgi:tellurite resistance protein TehA-like permease
MKNRITINWEVTLLSYSLRALLFIFLAPISILSITLKNILNLNYSVYKKSLGKLYKKFIKKKIKVFFQSHKINYKLDFKSDYNKPLIHHSYNINTPHQPKLMNYVSLYGFKGY